MGQLGAASMQVRQTLDEQNTALQEQAKLGQGLLTWAQNYSNALNAALNVRQNENKVTEALFASQKKLVQEAKKYGDAHKGAIDKSSRAYNMLETNAIDFLMQVNNQIAAAKTLGASNSKAADMARNGWNSMVSSLSKGLGISKKEATALAEEITGMTKKDYVARVKVQENPAANAKKVQEEINAVANEDYKATIEVTQTGAIDVKGQISAVFAEPIIQEVIVRRSGGGDDGGGGTEGSSLDTSSTTREFTTQGNTAALAFWKGFEALSGPSYAKVMANLQSIARGGNAGLGWMQKLMQAARDTDKEDQARARKAQNRLDKIRNSYQRVIDAIRAWKAEVKAGADEFRNWAAEQGIYQYRENNRNDQILKNRVQLNQALAAYNDAVSNQAQAYQRLYDWQHRNDVTTLGQIQAVEAQIATLTNSLQALNAEWSSGIDGQGGQTAWARAKQLWSEAKSGWDAARSALESWNKELNNTKTLREYYDEAKQRFEEIKTAAADMARGVKEAIMGAMDFKSAAGSRNFLRTLQRQATASIQFATELKRFQQLGASKEILAEIQKAGIVDGLNLMKKLSEPGALATAERLMSQVAAVAESVSTDMTNSVYAQELAAAQANVDARAALVSQQYANEVAQYQAMMTEQQNIYTSTLAAEIANTNSALAQQLALKAQLEAQYEQELIAAVNWANFAVELTRQAAVDSYKAWLESLKTMPTDVSDAIANANEAAGKKAGKQFGKAFKQGLKGEINDIDVGGAIIPNSFNGQKISMALKAYERTGGRR